MFRSHTCGELRLSDAGKSVTLAGWVQRARKMGGMTFVDLRDRYGITQLVFNEAVNAELCERANHLGREFVIQITGEVNERSNKNMNIPTGEIEIIVSVLNVLNSAVTPPFTIEDNSDGGDDIRMKFRYLDLRRNCVRKNLELRHKMTMEVRRYLDSKGFLEVETPMLVGSTPEGARDFVVPSRMNPGQFYALPQSPQTLKQLLMVSGFDRYFQIVKCFRDEDLRADRQPEFTQIDCEMSFVEQEDIISTFEGMAKHLFKELRGVELSEPFLRMTWADAMKYTRKLYQRGQQTIPSDTVCFPAKLVHGHIQTLIDEGAETIFYPCMSYNFDEHLGDNHYNCPVVAYYPEVINNNMKDVQKICFIKEYFGVHMPNTLPLQFITVGQWDLLYLCGNGLACLLCFYSRNRRTLYTLATLPVIAGDDGIFPLYIDPLADLFQRSSSHQGFYQFVFRKRSRFQFHHHLLRQQAIQRRKRRKYLCVIQILNRSSLFVKAAQIDIVPMDSFVERTDGDTTGGRKQREAYIITVQSDSAGSRLVIFNG